MKIVIDDLIELIKKLKEKIEKHKNELSSNEALVRYALIDPFLRALGWDTENPEQIKPEFSTDAGRPDYALLFNEKILAFLGAKKLGKDEDLKKHIEYCISEGVPYFITSDGNKWEIYSLKEFEKKLPEKKIANWEILNDDPRDIAIKAIIISNIGRLGDIPQTPISKVENLSNNDTKKQENEHKKNIYGQKRMKLKDNEYEIKKQYDILVNTANWLIEEGKLKKADCPVDTGGRKRYVINIEPKHKDGSNFRAPKKLTNGLFIESHWNGKTIRELSKQLLKKFGYDPNILKIY